MKTIKIPSTYFTGRLLLVGLASLAAPLLADQKLAFEQTIQPLLKQFCLDCHSTKKQKGDLDLERFTSLDLVKRDPTVWEHSLGQIRDKEMPPKGKPKPSAEQTKLLTDWMQGTLDDIALANAGDPGPVVLRRLSNMEYTYTLRDLTGVDSLNPAKEFPVDGAAGEGFTNVGAALVMSPALLTKYLDAAKDVASHAVLTPTGIQFSGGTSSRDWTDETLARIREFYAEFSDTTEQSVAVNGAEKVSNKGGRLPIEKYLTATLQERAAIASGSKKIADVARQRRLSAKYLGLLWAMLQDNKPSPLLDPLLAKWREGSLAVADIEAWQQALWRFTNIGHLGKVGGPKSWMEPVTPLAAKHELRMKLQPPSNGGDLTLYLATSDAGDGNENDFALWEKARLITPGHGELLLRDVRSVVQQMMRHRDAVTESVARCLAAANEAATTDGHLDLAALAKKHNVDGKVLAGWLNYLGIGTAGEVKLEPLLVKKSERSPAYEFIKGWTGDNALSVLANSSDAPVKIPGTMPPNSVATHPSPKLASVIAWRSPVTGKLRVSGKVQDGHTVCGNGITYALELRRGQTREVLAAGESKGSTMIPMGPFQNVRVLTGDVIALVIDPRDGDHTCDHTTVNLTLNDGKTEWDLAKDVSPDILAGNPHADRHGNKAVWHFLSQPAAGAASSVIPSDSLLSKWQKAKDVDERKRIAALVKLLLQQDVATASPTDRELRNQLLSFNGPLLANAWRSVKAQAGDGSVSPYGLDPAMFGKHPKGDEVAATSLCVHAPSVIKLRLPASLVVGAELVTTGRLHPTSGGESSVQMQVLTTKPAASSGLQTTVASSAKEGGAWNSSHPSVIFDSPILVQDGSVVSQRFEKAFDDFRSLFPAALCYSKIVPADEVVTLTLFHREDEQLRRLILDDAQSAELDRLWNELHFVSQDALTLVDAYEQIWQFSSQDGPDAPNGDKRLEPMREPIKQGAEAFKKLQVEVEPKQVQAVLDFATQAWRRPLRDAEQKELRTLYQKLRTQEMPHAKAVRMMLARVLVAPAFLYRGEKAAPGPKATPVNDWEIATRLSYFLWSSAPDAELTKLATSGKIHDPEVLAAQVKRMMKDQRIRRLSTEFGCQYLHVREVAELDEKSERHFPTFINVRESMQEEVTRFFIDLFQNDRSVLSLLDADHTFLNKTLAEHYGLSTAATSPDWQRVNNLHAHGRGGILGFAATLAKQAGASRTSGILRGAWLCEVVLGEKLPVPPKGVPILPEQPPDGLTERQLVEKHSSDANCAACHRRIDPFGFALEGFDAIGRARKADTKVILPDGSRVDGLDGLRSYLLDNRSDDFLRQFCRKLVGYALGRSVQLSDKPLIASMLTQLKTGDHNVGSAIELIVRSPQFREVRGKDFVVHN